MVHVPTFTIKNQPNVGKYAIHGSYGLLECPNQIQVTLIQILVIGIFRFSDFLFPVRQRLWVSFGVATLPHLPVMSLWKKLMDIQKPLAGVTRCASWQEGR